MKKPKLKTLRNKLQTVFSLYIRTRDLGICRTCGAVKPIKEMQAGHFISSVHWGTRYDERNVHCQCFRCNIRLKGNMIPYYESMVSLYSVAGIEELKKQSKWTLLEFAAHVLKLPPEILTQREVYAYLTIYYAKKLRELR